MRKKYRWMITISAISALVCLGFGIYFFWFSDPISPRIYRRIKLGMTQKEIEAIIGIPPGNYNSRPQGIGGITSKGPWGFSLTEIGLPEEEIPPDWLRGSEKGKVQIWWGNNNAIKIAFDKDGRAIGLYLLEVFP